jgi:hypothetical protein
LADKGSRGWARLGGMVRVEETETMVISYSDSRIKCDGRREDERQGEIYSRLADHGDMRPLSMRANSIASIGRTPYHEFTREVWVIRLKQVKIEPEVLADLSDSLLK